MKKEKYSRYWYTSVLNMVKHYPAIKNDPSAEAQRYVVAIERAIEDTKAEEDGEYKIKAIDLMFFRGINTADGTSQKVYASKKSVYRWVSAFVYRVGEYVGY